MIKCLNIAPYFVTKNAFCEIVAAFIVINTVPIMTMNNELFRRIQNRQLFNVLVQNSISIFIHEISRYNKMISILEVSHRLVPPLYHLKSLIIFIITVSRLGMSVTTQGSSGRQFVTGA